MLYISLARGLGRVGLGWVSLVGWCFPKARRCYYGIYAAEASSACSVSPYECLGLAPRLPGVCTCICISREAKILHSITGTFPG